jgi:Transposase DDE domain
MARIGQRLVRATGMMYVPRSVQMRKDPIDATYERGERAGIPPDLIRDFVYGLLAEEIHAKRVESIANAVTGVTRASTLSVQTIGHGLAAALDKSSKHAIKQVDRLLSNSKVVVWDLFEAWVRYVLAERSAVVVAIDWTDFEPDDHVTCAAHLITNHGRSTALVWKTIPKSELKGQQSQIEDAVIERLHAIAPPHVNITLLADRAFGDQARYEHLTLLGWDYVIRFREGILVHYRGETQPAAAWVPKGGRALRLADAAVTADKHPVGAVVVVKRAKMKEAWCLATNRADAAAGIIKLYSRRFTIEETFRDQKDLRFGMGLSATHIRDCGRRDRLLFLSALAHALVTLLGAAAEAIGYDRLMKANTVKTRTHSLFRQGSYWFSRIPTMSVERLAPLLRALEAQLAKYPLFKQLFGVL